MVFVILLLNRTFPSSIHSPASFIISFFITAEYNPIVYMYHPFITHLSIGGYLSWFLFLAVVKRVAMNMGVPVPLGRILHYLPRSGRAGHMIALLVLSLRGCRTDCYSGHTSSQLHQQ